MPAGLKNRLIPVLHPGQKQKDRTRRNRMGLPFGLKYALSLGDVYDIKLRQDAAIGNIPEYGGMVVFVGRVFGIRRYIHITDGSTHHSIVFIFVTERKIMQYSCLLGSIGFFPHKS
jgi:hypothetical protein